MAPRLFILVALAAAGGCAGTTPHRDAIAADGVFVRHLRLRVAPEQTKQLESILAACADIASATRTEGGVGDWLIYREPPGRYWLITFSDTIDGFRYPAGLSSFVRYMADRSPADGEAILSTLGRLRFEIDWEIVFQQKRAWSTTEGVEPSTHPKARIMARTIKPGLDRQFSTALAERTAFFPVHAYPLPIEGFVTRRGDPAVALQVVFPTDWPTFHATHGFGAFVKSLPQAARDDYARRKAALMRTMSNAAWYDGSFAEELSFSQ